MATTFLVGLLFGCSAVAFIMANDPRAERSEQIWGNVCGSIFLFNALNQAFHLTGVI